MATRVFRSDEVAKHKSKNDCWIVVDGRVLDVTKFLKEHPGGDDAILEVAGKDATREFIDIGHSDEAVALLEGMKVGVLRGYEGRPSKLVSSKPSAGKGKKDTPPFKDIPAFVIKESKPSSAATVLEFVLPTVLVGGAFYLKHFFFVEA